jgi:prepilin-type N-terminal cleavage/methylation domain-containing protein
MTAFEQAPHATDERGFTIIEVLVAMMILLVGVLGTVALVDGANATTSTVKARVGATNLAKELIEVSRSLEYARVTQSLLAGEMKAQPGLADASAAAGWQIDRRGVTYTVTAAACTFDDATDKTGTRDATFCAGLATTPPGDENPDDYRRVTFSVSWQDRAETRLVSQTTILGNPSGGLGPPITSFTSPNATITNPNATITNPLTTSVAFKVATSPAQNVRWTADDGGVGGQAAGGPTAWSFSWIIGSIGTFSCGTKPGWTLDGDYLLTARAQDSRGIPGDLRTFGIRLDRSPPAPPCGLAGGRNNGIVDLQWSANNERDISGYRVFQVALAGQTSDREVCAVGPERTSCYDSQPPAGTVQYYVTAYDVARQTQSQRLSVAETANQAPTPPGQLTAGYADGLPKLQWTAATDPDGTIQFYRIYRSGASPSDRLDSTSGAQLTYIDRLSANGANSYWVTAVDDKFRESVPVGPVTP